MTDLPPHAAPGRPPDADDELVSASLDGETTAADEARIAADPVLVARREELAAVRALVAEPPPSPPDAERDRAVTAALAATTVVRLDTRRRTSASWRGRAVAGIAAALVAVLAVAGVVAISRTNDTDSGSASATTAVGREALATMAGGATTTFAAGATTVAASGGIRGTDTAETADTTMAGAATTAAPAGPAAVDINALTDLGPADEAAVRNAAIAFGVPPAVPGPCPAVPADWRVIARATWQGQPALVYIEADGATPIAVIVVAADACTTLAVFPLP